MPNCTVYPPCVANLPIAASCTPPCHYFGYSGTVPTITTWPGPTHTDYTPPYGPLVQIRGCVFIDQNLDGHEQNVEKGQAGVTVYIDMDNNGKLDAGEPQTVSASCPIYSSCYYYYGYAYGYGEGGYEFNLESPLPEGAVVREIPPLGYMETGPQRWGDPYSDYNFYKTPPGTGNFESFDFGNFVGPPCVSAGVGVDTTTATNPNTFEHAQISVECLLPCSLDANLQPVYYSQDPIHAYVTGGDPSPSPYPGPKPPCVPCNVKDAASCLPPCPAPTTGSMPICHVDPCASLPPNPICGPCTVLSYSCVIGCTVIYTSYGNTDICSPHPCPYSNVEPTREDYVGDYVEGCVFIDHDQDSHMQSDEQGQGNVVVYIDLNNDGAFDSGSEPQATSQDFSGYYRIYYGGPLPPEAVVREVPPPGYDETGPRPSSDPWSQYNYYLTDPGYGAFKAFNFGNFPTTPPCSTDPTSWANVNAATTLGTTGDESLVAKSCLGCSVWERDNWSEGNPQLPSNSLGVTSDCVCRAVAQDSLNSLPTTQAMGAGTNCICQTIAFERTSGLAPPDVFVDSSCTDCLPSDLSSAMSIPATTSCLTHSCATTTITACLHNLCPTPCPLPLLAPPAPPSGPPTEIATVTIVTDQSTPEDAPLLLELPMVIGLAEYPPATLEPNPVPITPANPLATGSIGSTPPLELAWPVVPNNLAATVPPQVSSLPVGL